MMHLSKTLTGKLTTEPAVPAQTTANTLDRNATTEFTVPTTPVPNIPGVSAQGPVWDRAVSSSQLHDQTGC